MNVVEYRKLRAGRELRLGGLSLAVEPIEVVAEPHLDFRLGLRIDDFREFGSHSFTVYLGLWTFSACWGGAA